MDSNEYNSSVTDPSDGEGVESSPNPLNIIDFQTPEADLRSRRLLPPFMVPSSEYSSSNRTPTRDRVRSSARSLIRQRSPLRLQESSQSISRSRSRSRQRRRQQQRRPRDVSPIVSGGRDSERTFPVPSARRAMFFVEKLITSYPNPDVNEISGELRQELMLHGTKLLFEKVIHDDYQRLEDRFVHDDSKMWTLLQIIILTDKAPLVELCLEFGVDVNASLIDDSVSSSSSSSSAAVPLPAATSGETMGSQNSTDAVMGFGLEEEEDEYEDEDAITLRAWNRTNCSTVMVERESRSMLHFACYYGKLETVKVCVAHCANPNLKTQRNETPLTLAAVHRYWACVNYIICSYHESMDQIVDLNCNAQPHSNLVLFRACEQNNCFQLRLLLQHGADPQMRFGGSGYPIHYMVSQESVDGVAALLEHGADPNVTNAAGQTPLHLVGMQVRNKALLRVLLTYQAMCQHKTQMRAMPMVITNVLQLAQERRWEDAIEVLDSLSEIGLQF